MMDAINDMGNATLVQVIETGNVSTKSRANKKINLHLYQVIDLSFTVTRFEVSDDAKDEPCALLGVRT